MKIAEIYRSIQGEGTLTGTASIFVRTSGCNLRCWFCDTPHASWKPTGKDLSVDEILQRLGQWDCRHVVLTGGEPMLHAELIPLSQTLGQLGKHVTIETAGTLFLPVACDLMSISPKLASSTPAAESHPRWARRHQRDRFAPAVVRRLVAAFPYQIKFVIDSPADCAEVDRILAQLPEVARDQVLLMPQGCRPDQLEQQRKWLEPYCQQHGFTFCPRRQFEWFDAVRGT